MWILFTTKNVSPMGHLLSRGVDQRLKNRTVEKEKVTAVCLGLRLQYCQSCQFSQDDGFCGEDDGFCGEDDGFLAKTKDFLLFLRLRQKSFVFATLFAMCLPHAAMFTLHTNE